MVSSATPGEWEGAFCRRYTQARQLFGVVGQRRGRCYTPFPGYPVGRDLGRGLGALYIVSKYRNGLTPTLFQKYARMITLAIAA